MTHTFNRPVTTGIRGAVVPVTGQRGVEPPLPATRGPLTAALFDALRGRPRSAAPPAVASTAPLVDDDLQLALYCCYELHYRGFAGIAAEREWDPWVLALRSELEAALLRGIRSDVAGRPQLPGRAVDALAELAAVPAGPSLSRYVESYATRTQLEELCIHRSAYQRKEADPHTWVLPRLGGATKAAAVEIQADEYGNGSTAEIHAELFARTMTCLGLDATYGAYLDQLPAATLATTNVISMFGLHRRWRGAVIGHLALFEMTSRQPMGRYAAALERFGVAPEGRRFFEVHVDVDAHHERVALDEMVPALLEAEPALAPDVIFGAAALSAVEARFTRHLLRSWSTGRSSLLMRSDDRRRAS